LTPVPKLGLAAKLRTVIGGEAANRGVFRLVAAESLRQILQNLMHATVAGSLDVVAIDDGER
jgi:hypothetical protein